MIALVLTLSLQVAPPQPARAELCLAHVNAMMTEAMETTGRVAGPSWYIRDWWTARLPEGDAAEAVADDQHTSLEASLRARKATDPEGYAAELQACVDEAIDEGAVPGMEPA